MSTQKNVLSYNHDGKYISYPMWLKSVCFISPWLCCQWEIECALHPRRGRYTMSPATWCHQMMSRWQSSHTTIGKIFLLPVFQTTWCKKKQIYNEMMEFYNRKLHCSLIPWMERRLLQKWCLIAFSSRDNPHRQIVSTFRTFLFWSI